MKRVFLGALLSILILQSFAQDKAKIKDAFLEAEYYLLYEDYVEALPFYLQIDKTGFTNANIKYRIGLCYLNIAFQTNEAIPYLEEAVKNVTEKYKEGNFKETMSPTDAYYCLAKAYRINNNLNEAIEYYKKYSLTLEEKEVANISYIEEEIKSCERAKELKENAVYFKKINIADPVNDKFSNINPVISNDETILIYTSKQRFYDAIFYSRKENGKWSTPVNITPQIGSDGEFYPSSISFDNKTLILYKDDVFGCDLYISHLFENLKIWSIAEKLPKTINSMYWETHGCLSPDGNTLYFTSNRLGGYGGLDIYKSTKNADGEWGEAINLGPEINTVFNEETPFITEDGLTLYFSSQGHYNMGGFDIFRSKLTDTNTWAKTLNMGYPLNTTGDDLFYLPVKDGKNAYYSALSDRGLLIADIYRIEWTEEKPTRDILINGSITLQDNVTEFFDHFTVDIFNINTKDTIRNNLPVDQNGKYSLELARGKYRFIIAGKGYKTKTEEVVIPEDFSSNEITIDSYLVPMSVATGEHIITKSIYFNFDDFTLSRESKIELEKLLVVMDKYPDLQIKVIGHTDAIGTPEYNQNLSEKRAKAVIDYLVDKGIDKGRIVGL